MERKVIWIDSYSGNQKISSLRRGGKILSGEIIWDEAVDGPVPSELLDSYEFVSKSGSSLVEDAAKKTVYDANVLTRASKAAVKKARLRMDFGSELIATMTASSVSKGLTFAERRTLRSNLADIKSALETGALDDARDLIDSVVADGTLVTDADKTAIMGAIDSYLANE